MLFGHGSYLLISSKVFQHTTLLINHDQFFSQQINSFSRKLYSIKHGTAFKAAEKSNRMPHLSLYRRHNIHNVEIFAPDLYCNIMLHFQFHPKNYN